MKLVAHLREPDLWHQFHAQRNEMIITKAGRCMFPLLRVDFHQLPDTEESGPIIDLHGDYSYRVQLEISSRDEHKWKWLGTHWVPLLSSRAFGSFHSETTFRSSRMVTTATSLHSSQIISKGLDFERVKLTNRDNGPLAITLQSFHRYLPIIHIVPLTGSPQQQPQQVEQIISFPETEFIAVTHYQNEQITLLKKSYNPHAKGFVISDEVPSMVGSIDWPVERRQRRVRRRVVPVIAITTLMSTPRNSLPLPSDEEELQGSLALQLLSSDRPEEK